ncbi:MAG: S-methyl-5-thioribose-1-phosphate isomerase [Planctomycetota bacterium]|nr:S-methyl-5-thioribose-1-phosphate isomerase [Planctomycetota bacterium]MDA1178324.1 S-methyl-5-thioribose-1-phosphate isomerase [Planctomycetota bacterium]
MTSLYRSIEWCNGAVRILDQRLLPATTIYRDYTQAAEVAEAIRTMVIRGAPAIGAAAAWGLALSAQSSRSLPMGLAWEYLQSAATILRESRPTAVNLFWAIDRVVNAVSNPPPQTSEELFTRVLHQATLLADEDISTNRALSLHGLPLIPERALVIHHCNTGSLATVDYGTALGVIRAAHEHGRALQVLVDETRPRLQGARLTSWELLQLGIPHEIIVDGAAAHLMRTRRVDLCLVGCDRVAANGDVANKIGTYQLAIAARAHQIPFYVAAPTSTIDLATNSGDDIEIEYRDAEEVTTCGSGRLAPDGVRVCNPAFDITPADYVTAFVTESGIVRPPFATAFKRLLGTRLP